LSQLLYPLALPVNEQQILPPAQVVVDEAHKVVGVGNSSLDSIQCFFLFDGSEIASEKSNQKQYHQPHLRPWCETKPKKQTTSEL